MCEIISLTLGEKKAGWVTCSFAVINDVRFKTINGMAENV